MTNDRGSEIAPGGAEWKAKARGFGTPPRDPPETTMYGVRGANGVILTTTSEAGDVGGRDKAC
jgi:hypothetical protein